MYIPLFSGFYTFKRCLLGISEPSTVALSSTKENTDICHKLAVNEESWIYDRRYLSLNGRSDINGHCRHLI